MKIGPLDVMADTRVADQYFTSDPRPGSDSEAALRLLKQKGNATEGTYIRVRMFHLPDDSHRKELMIIYGEQTTSGAADEQAQKAAAANRAVQGLKVH